MLSSERQSFGVALDVKWPVSVQLVSSLLSLVHISVLQAHSDLEAGGSGVQDQTDIHETLSQNNNKASPLPCLPALDLACWPHGHHICLPFVPAPWLPALATPSGSDKYHPPSSLCLPLSSLWFWLPPLPFSFFCHKKPSPPPKCLSPLVFLAVPPWVSLCPQDPWLLSLPSSLPLCSFLPPPSITKANHPEH